MMLWRRSLQPALKRGSDGDRKILAERERCVARCVSFMEAVLSEAGLAGLEINAGRVEVLA
jgi:hypothetical protein